MDDNCIDQTPERTPESNKPVYMMGKICSTAKDDFIDLVKGMLRPVHYLNTDIQHRHEKNTECNTKIGRVAQDRIKSILSNSLFERL